MKILLLGIGNVLFSDEGIGVHFVNYIAENYQFSHHLHQLDILDGGTLAQGLIPTLSKYDYMIIADTVNANGVKPGEVYFFDFDKAPTEIDWQGSAHEVEMRQTLHMMDMVGDKPKTYILGVTPTILEPMVLGITKCIEEAVPLMEQTLINHLNQLDFKCNRINNTSIIALIPSSYKPNIPLA
ncbi:MAG: HyaD/HybD family hydrogenase maturation endopeptidase [Shewanella sp.]